MFCNKINSLILNVFLFRDVPKQSKTTHRDLLRQTAMYILAEVSPVVIPV